MDSETKELLDEVCSLGDDPAMSAAIAECVRMALDDRDRRIATLEGALRQLRRGRECAASRCQAPLGGPCTCGNARLCNLVATALAETP